MTTTPPPAPALPALELDGVSVVRDRRPILDEITWRVHRGEQWVVLGANGSGKSTLLRVATMIAHPSRGDVTVLGERLGHTDVRRLRARLGYLAAALGADLRPSLSASDVVMTAKHAALEPWWHRYDDQDLRRAHECLTTMGVDAFGERPFGSLSSGEAQRVLLARTLMNDPGLVLLDEPAARLDLGGREQLVEALGELMQLDDGPPVVLVTHHVDEIPAATTHALLLRAGRVLAAGPIESTLTAEGLSTCFDVALRLDRRDDGRWTAWAG